MSSNIDKIIFTEAEYFYKSEHAVVDYSQMQSFSLIKSCIEIFAYYGIGDFVPSDVKEFFEKIQLIQKKNGKVFVRSGAGIVADSDPEKEYEECLNKAKASLTALRIAQEVE